MVGRRRVPGNDATSRSIVALALAVVLALVFVPSMGPGAVPGGLAAAASPAGAVVHLLGDEVVAAAPASGPDVRARSLVPGDPTVATLVVMAALVACFGARWLLGAPRMAPPATTASGARSGRSPPPPAATR